MQRGDTTVEPRSTQQTAGKEVPTETDTKKTKTFAIPTPLAQWFADTVYEEPTGVVKKEWLYEQYVKFCNERGTFRPKHKQIFSKLVFTVFPRAGSCRLGSIGNQVPYYFGIKRIKRNNNKAGGAGKKPIASLSAEFDRFSIPQTRSALGGDESRSSSFDMGSQGQNKWSIEPHQTKIETPCGKRKRETPERIDECVKKVKKEAGEEEEQTSEDTTLLAEQLKHRLLELHRTLAQQEAEPYQTDVESYVGLFVENFWPELAPLQWDLTFDETVPMSEQEMNSFALCLCCSLFCGALVKNDISFAKDTLLLCSSLVNALVLQTKVTGASEKLQKNFGVSLLFLARGLVDCSLFQNDIDAVILAKNYCAMAAEIFP